MYNPLVPPAVPIDAAGEKKIGTRRRGMMLTIFFLIFPMQAIYVVDDLDDPDANPSNGEIKREDMKGVKDEAIYVIDEDGNGTDAEEVSPEANKPDEYDMMMDESHLVDDCDEVVRTPHFVPRTQAAGLSRDEHHARAVSNLTVYSIGT